MTDTEYNSYWPIILDALARILALLLFFLFAILLWEAIEIGSANSSFQHVTLQITTLETSVSRLETSRRDAELRALRLETATSVSEAGGISANEAKVVLSNAARDYAAEANRYFAAVCDVGRRLADIGRLPGAFMPSTTRLKECPSRELDLAAGQFAKASDPADQIQAVRVVLAHYGVLANSYMLPILFGMLGALTFAIRDMVVNPEHIGDLPKVTGYILRLFLGAIFGLIIGYVNFAGTPASSLAASPLLLSLVAGFATDAVISMLDRVALAISYDREKL